MSITFQEKQRFNQIWVWILLIAILLIPIYGIYQQIYLGIPFGNNPMPDFGLIVFLVFMLGIIGFIGMIQMNTKIDAESIKLDFFPFSRKEINWEDIESAQVINYGFAGGWGIRMGSKYETIYNTSGSKGLALRLKNGTQLCIGTQKDTELEVLIEEARVQGKLES